MLKYVLAIGLGGLAFGAAYYGTVLFNGPPAAPPGMAHIPGGEFTMGTDGEMGWPDEKPAHRVRVSPFFIDVTEVTNAEFRKFVAATNHVTTAERAPTMAEIMANLPPGTPPPPKEKLVPGAVVFRPTPKSVDTRDCTQWWEWTPGASWQHPEGPASNLDGRDDHPVVHVSWFDATAYAKWAGKRLPTEAEWECAARGRLAEQPFVWGSEKPTDDCRRANIWQGEFPCRNTKNDGYERTAPVKSFPPNGYGLYDMAGNVWEWCGDWYQRDLYRSRAGKSVINPKGPDEPAGPGEPQRSQRGGSFLCHETYCTRYRPSARHGCSPDTGMSHVGFRCAIWADEWAKRK